MSKKFSYGKQTIDAEDIQAVVDVLKSDFLTQGPKVNEFEQRLRKETGAKYAVAVNSGTAALHLSMMALKIGSGDAGITSPITFVASANCLRYVGAKVQLADVEVETGLLNPFEIEKHITAQTKVIIPVHYAGQSCDMEVISKIAKKHNLYVVEDASHAIGSMYKKHKVGSCYFSDLTVFSFHPVKTITTSEGGAVTTNSLTLYRRLIKLRTHGITQKPTITPWYYEMEELGFNYRMPDVLAALGLSQLKKLNSFAKRRREIVEVYKKAFEDDNHFTCIKEHAYSKATFHLFPLLINLKKVKTKKIEIFKLLNEAGIKSQVHYIPVYKHPYYKKHGFGAEKFPGAEMFYKQVMSLPLYPSLSVNDVKQVIKIIKAIVK